MPKRLNPRTPTRIRRSERRQRRATATVSGGGVEGDWRVVSCLSVQETERWRANLAMAALKVAGDGVADESTMGERLFRWPSQQQQQQ